MGVTLGLLELSGEVSWKVRLTVLFRNVRVLLERPSQKAMNTLLMQIFTQIPIMASEIGALICVFGVLITFVT